MAEPVVHVVIPTAVERANPSLPVALKSIRRFTPYVPVTVGHDWGLCSHIPTRQDNSTWKAIFGNVARALRTVVETDWISDPFVWSNDDIYWLESAAPARWALGLLEDTRDRSRYGHRKRLTSDLLRSAGLPTWDYESHTPLLIDKANAVRALDIAGPNGAWRSVFGNLTGVPDHVGPDVKLARRDASLPDAAWVSTVFDPMEYPHLVAALTARNVLGNMVV